MQNKIFLDKDIVLDLLLDNRENSKSTQDFLLNYLNDDTLLVISSASLDAIYEEGAVKNNQLNETINLINEIESSKELWQIIDPGVRERSFALEYLGSKENASYNDLKEYFCAFDSSCSIIISNNIDFPKLDLKIVRTNESLENFENKNIEVQEKEEKKGFFSNLFGKLFK